MTTPPKLRLLQLLAFAFVVAIAIRQLLTLTAGLASLGALGAIYGVLFYVLPNLDLVPDEVLQRWPRMRPAAAALARGVILLTIAFVWILATVNRAPNTGLGVLIIVLPCLGIGTIGIYHLLRGLGLQSDGRP